MESNSSSIFDTQFYLQVTPRGVLFSRLGGFEQKDKALAQAKELEAALVVQMQTNNVVIDLAYAEGVPRLVFVDKTKTDATNDL